MGKEGEEGDWGGGVGGWGAFFIYKLEEKQFFSGFFHICKLTFCHLN